MAGEVMIVKMRLVEWLNYFWGLKASWRIVGSMLWTEAVRD
jgi:hypothetical protein